jgi:DNA invertase Pin-like site-specific DNA recombinase
MFIGYARVSTAEQNLDLQTDALTKAGCERIFTDTAGGAKSERPGLAEALSFMRESDTLVVWKLDRLGRSLKHLIETVVALQRAQKGFRSLQENIDTSTSGGKLIFHIFASLAEFERDIIRERTKAGLASARSRGRLGGRPRVMDAKKLKMARSLYADAKTQVVEICEGLGISRATFYRHVVAPPPTTDSRINATMPIPGNPSE